MAPALSFHEGLACDAVVRRIEQREHNKRTRMRHPEREGHNAPVEFVCEIGSTLFAFEHTGIEPFSGHMQLEAQAEQYLKPIVTEARKVLSPIDRFSLHVPVDAFLSRRGAEIRQISDALIHWITQVAPLLTAARPGYRDGATIGPQRDIPFQASLYRSDAGGFPGGFDIVHRAPADLEQGRVARLRRAYDKKCPKLLIWKEHGARSILILEENDVQITNHELVCAAVGKVEINREDTPDEIWLVSTAVAAVWNVWWLRINQEYCANLSYWGRSLSEVDPRELDNVTGR